MERYFSNYKGIVIQNNDPKMGRVKVYIPEVMTTLFKDWNNDKEKDKQITYLGANMANPDATTLTPELLTRLKKILPWAEVNQPVFGQSSSGTYNASKDVFSISNEANSSEQQNAINKRSTGTVTSTPTATGETTTANTYASTPESEMTKTQDELQETCSETNTIDINNYLNCNIAPPSVSTAKSDTKPTCGNASMGSPIEDFTYVANAYKPNYFSDVNQSNPSSPFVTTPTTPISSTPSIPTIGGSITPSPISLIADNIHSVSLRFIPSTNYKSTRSTNKSLVYQTNEAAARGYNQTIVTVIPNNNSPALTAIAAHAAPIIYTLIRGNVSLSAVETFVPILFAPDPAYLPTNISKLDTSADSIKISAETVKFDGENFSFLDGKDEIIIPKTSVTNININYSRPLDDIDVSSERLGDVAKFLFEYKIPAQSAFGQMVIPPASIPISNPLENSGSSSGSMPSAQTLQDAAKDCSSSSIGTYNRGGGGSELFNKVASPLLPINNINNASVCGACPESKASVNQGATVPKQNDPNKVSGNNIKNSSIDPLPPMTTTTQTNKAKGIISIPGVGAHVSVYFEQGNPLYPIVDGIFYTKEDHKGIHNAELGSK
jgi:hypothetical protein